MRSFRQIGLGILLLAAAWLLAGCPPPHSNPFDPEAPNYIPPGGSTAPADIQSRVRSMHTSRNITTQDTYAVLAEVWTEGSERVDSAWVAYRDWPSLALRLTPQAIWSARLTASYFSDPLLGSVIGQPFSFTVATDRDCTYLRSPVYLFRVIEATPTLRTPKGGDTTSAYPQFQWYSFTASYPYTYTVSILRTEQEFEVLMWSSDPLPSSDSSATAPDSLEDGMYYWTLLVSDGLENGSRSKEGVFTVLTGGTP